jgi:type IV pilus modification protein PilV
VRRSRQGFSLISVMVALVLLSVGIMALARTQFMVVRVTRQESARSQALQLATAYLEEVRARDAWSLASEAPATIDSTGALAANGPFTRELTVTPMGTQLLRVQLSVTPRLASPIQFETMIFRVSQ